MLLHLSNRRIFLHTFQCIHCYSSYYIVHKIFVCVRYRIQFDQMFFFKFPWTYDIEMLNAWAVEHTSESIQYENIKLSAISIWFFVVGSDVSYHKAPLIQWLCVCSFVTGEWNLLFVNKTSKISSFNAFFLKHQPNIDLNFYLLKCICVAFFILNFLKIKTIIQAIFKFCSFHFLFFSLNFIFFSFHR